MAVLSSEALSSVAYAIQETLAMLELVVVLLLVLVLVVLLAGIRRRYLQVERAVALDPARQPPGAGIRPQPADWDRWVGDQVSLVVLRVPYASFIHRFVTHVARVEKQHPEPLFTIVTADAVPRRWLDNILFNKSLIELRQALMRQHSRAFTLVRYYLPA